MAHHHEICDHFENILQTIFESSDLAQTEIWQTYHTFLSQHNGASQQDTATREWLAGETNAAMEHWGYLDRAAKEEVDTILSMMRATLLTMREQWSRWWARGDEKRLVKRLEEFVWMTEIMSSQRQ